MEAIQIAPHEVKSFLNKLRQVNISKMQDKENYTETSHETWKYVKGRLDEIWIGRVHPAIIHGYESLNFTDTIPDGTNLSDALERASGFRFYFSDHILPDSVLYEGYAERFFPTTTFIRNWEQRDYIVEPDLVHENRGHGSALANRAYADVCQKLGVIVRAFRYDPLIMEIMHHIHWFLVEFPLVQYKGENMIVGPGILSSPGECINSLENKNVRRHIIARENFGEVLDHIVGTPVVIDVFQNDLWVFKNFEDFSDILTRFLPVYLKDKTGVLPMPY